MGSAANAAKAEVQGTGHQIEYKGRTFTLPPKLDLLKFSAAMLESQETIGPDARRNGKVPEDPAATARLLRVLFGPEQFVELVELGGTGDEVNDLIDRASKLYAEGGLPESSESSEFS